MLILIAGPYRSGTGDDPRKMAENLKRLEEPSYALFRAGHLPMIGEWVALPVWHAAGGKSTGDDLYEEIFHPTAGRLLQLCEGVLQTSGRVQGSRQRRPHRQRTRYSRLVSAGGCAGLCLADWLSSPRREVLAPVRLPTREMHRWYPSKAFITDIGAGHFRISSVAVNV